MKNKFLYSILMIYSCAQSPKINVHTPNLEDICPKIGKEIRVELKKEFNGDIDDFMKTYILKTSNQYIEFKIISEEEESYIKFNPIKKEIETGGLFEKKKTYKGLTLNGKSKDYEKKLNVFIDNIKSFDNPRWIYFNLDDVIECIERNSFPEHK